jgi:transcriptional regulator with AAA-type ATPase domain
MPSSSKISHGRGKRPYLIERYANKAGKQIRTIKKQTLELFQAYDWPGNIRELQNVIERAVILCASDTFAVEARWLKRDMPRRAGPAMSLVAARAAHERALIEAALSECRGRRPRGACHGRRSNRKSKPWAFPSSASKHDGVTEAPGAAQTSLASLQRRALLVHTC